MTLAQRVRLGCGVAVFLVMSITTIGATAMAQGIPAGTPSPNSAPNVAPSQPVGVPAIKPHGPQGNGAAFTAADVIQWGNGHQIGMQPPGAVRPQIVSVDFITAAQASQRMQGESIGRPDSSLVCYVQAHGDFIEYGPPGWQPEYAILHDYTLVLDAQTGNILVEG